MQNDDNDDDSCDENVDAMAQDETWHWPSCSAIELKIIQEVENHFSRILDCTDGYKIPFDLTQSSSIHPSSIVPQLILSILTWEPDLSFCQPKHPANRFRAVNENEIHSRVHGKICRW